MKKSLYEVRRDYQRREYRIGESNRCFFSARDCNRRGDTGLAIVYQAIHEIWEELAGEIQQ